MKILGYESLHWGGPPIRDLVQAAIDVDAPLLANLDPAYDAFSDILLLSTNFERLDAQYPGSRFVLTMRAMDDWLDSRRRHVENNIRRKAAGEYAGTFLVVDEDGWRAEMTAHVRVYADYFGSRDDFLEADLTAQPDWGPLCRLLGVAAPEVDFPWANRDKARLRADAEE